MVESDFYMWFPNQSFLLTIWISTRCSFYICPNKNFIQNHYSIINHYLYVQCHVPLLPIYTNSLYSLSAILHSIKIRNLKVSIWQMHFDSVYLKASSTVSRFKLIYPHKLFHHPYNSLWYLFFHNLSNWIKNCWMSNFK